MAKTSRITISHVASASNVSKMTVSRVLNGKPGVSEETRQHVLTTMQTMGFVAKSAARMLRGFSRVIGLVLPSLVAPYIAEVLVGISVAAEQLDYGLMLYTQIGMGHASRTSYYASLLSNGLADGVVLIVPYDYQTLVQNFKDYEVPYVIIDHHGNTAAEPAITATNRKGVLDAMRHLLAFGHTRIGFITGRMDMGCSAERLKGYQDGLAEVGIPYDSSLVLEGDFEQTTGFCQGRALLKINPRPTAIVASNDAMALGVMDAIKDAGLRVGEDISVVGFDDIPMAAKMYPALTTVRQPMAEMGKTAIELLVALLQGQRPLSLQRELATELIVRESTGHPGKRR